MKKNDEYNLVERVSERIKNTSALLKCVKNDEGVISANQELLESFVEYCLENPELRFWQALVNWSGKESVYEYTKNKELKDLFYE